MSSEHVCIGIDFGTSNCSIGVTNKRGQPIVILNNLESRCTPAYIGFNEKNEFECGEFIKKYHDNSSNGLAFGLKRLIAQSAPKGNLSYDKAALRELNAIEKAEKRDVDMLTSKLLGCLRLQAEEFLECGVTSAVLSVPYIFSLQACDKLRQAARNAGFVDVHLVVETHAAALGYLNVNGIWRRDKEVATNLLIFNYGGGFLEATFLNSVSMEDIICSEETSGVIGVTLTSAVGGGEEMTQRIMDHLNKMCKETTGFGLLENHRLRIEARLVAESIKGGVTRFEFSGVATGKDFQGTFTETDFMIACRGFLKEAEIAILEFKRKLSNYKVENIVLIGGSTRLRSIKDLLNKYFPRAKISETVNAEEAVVLGTGLLTKVSLSKAKTDDVGRLQIINIEKPVTAGDKIVDFFLNLSQYIPKFPRRPRP